MSSYTVKPPPGFILDGTYTAVTREHVVEIFDDETLVSRLPFGTTEEIIGHVTLAYERGHDNGRLVGQAEKAGEIRRALSL